MSTIWGTIRPRVARHPGGRWLLLLALVCTNAPAGEASGPFGLDELLSLPRVTDVVSGGGGRVAWLERSGGTTNVFVADAVGGAARQATRNTADDGVELSLVGFSGDGRQLAYLRGGAANAAGEFPNPAHLPDPTDRTLQVLDRATGQSRRVDDGTPRGLGAAAVAPDGARIAYVRGRELWAARFDGGEAVRLFTDRGSLRELSWSPDGTRLAFVTDRARYERGKYAFVGVFELATRRITYLEPGLGHDQNPVWSPDGRRVGFIRFGYEPRTWRFSNHRQGAPFSVMVVDAASGEGGAAWTSTPGYGSRFNGFGASGYSGLGGINNLLWLADDTLVFPSERTGWKLLYAVSARGGEARLLTPGRFEVDGVSLSPDRRRIAYWSNSEADPHRLDLFRLDLGEGLKPRPFGGDAEGGIRRDVVWLDDANVAYRHASPSVPERLVRHPARGQPQQLSSGPRPGDPITRKAAAAEVVTFPSLDGMEIPAVLYRPNRVEGKGRHPVIVHAHGGSRSKVYPVWNPGFGYPAVFSYFLSRGYYVLSVNFRSGTGYGLDFREPESYGGRGAGDVQDFIAAADYLKRQVPEIDPSRMAIFGHSYGGHIVSNVLARSDVYAAGIDSAGVGDWVVEMEKDFGEVLQFNIAERVELEALAHASSAISKIDEWGEEPILFLHGDDDGSAAMQQSLELYLALQRRGKPAEALVFPGESHGIDLRRNQERYLRRIEAFLQQYLQ